MTNEEVYIGSIRVFRPVVDKAQAIKVLEEASEVHGSCQRYLDTYEGNGSAADDWVTDDIIAECADTLQALANLLAGLGVYDMTEANKECWEKNHRRGRC